MATLSDLFLQDLAEPKQEYSNTNNIEIQKSQEDKDELEKNLNKIFNIINNGINIKDENNYYRFIEDIIHILGNIDKIIEVLHKNVINLYRPKFGELSSIIINPLQYLEVVKRCIYVSDITQVQFNDILPNSTAMTISIAASTNTNANLSNDTCINIENLIDDAFFLFKKKNELLKFVELEMDKIAPNLSSLVSPNLAAILICNTNGLRNLAEMPSQNIMLLGNDRKSRKYGLYITGVLRIELQQSYLSKCDIVLGVPELFKKKALRLLSSKCGLCARLDLAKSDKDGKYGKKWRDYIIKILNKAQEPPPPPLKKPLPIPEELLKSRRGGKRIRKIKEKFKMSRYYKKMNRMIFGEAEEEEYMVEGESVGLGLLSGENIGKMRSILPIKNKSKYYNNNTQLNNNTNGISTSISFTPYQGMQL
ncbi:putative U4/U6 small nuclear ribonucleoprotein Prp31 [Cryptosporidium serpentis]